MLRDFPFLAHRVHYELNVPNPIVELLERDERGNESVVDGNVVDYYKKFPLATKCFSLQELIDSGQHIAAVNPAIYESNDASDYGFTISDIYEAAQELAPNLKPKPMEE